MAVGQKFMRRVSPSFCVVLRNIEDAVSAYSILFALFHHFFRSNLPEPFDISVGIASGNLCHAFREFHMLSWVMFASRFTRIYAINGCLTTTRNKYSMSRAYTHKLGLISYSICIFKHLLGITYRFISHTR